MSTQSLYQNQARDYFEQTFPIDPSPFLVPLTQHLAPGSIILDVACGSGRDMLWLNKNGFSCSGLEISPDLADLARNHTGLPVIEADFETFDFSSFQVDALLLIGALVHVPHEKFAPIFKRILAALKSQGLVLITLKQGQQTQTFPDERVFYLWEKNQLMQVFKKSGLICIDYSVQVSQVRASDTWMSFLLKKTF